MLKDNERIDDLECRGYKIIQNPDGYCFTSDSVLLANLAYAKRSDRVVDLCSGSGVVALLMRAKHCPKETHEIELQPRLADMAKRSAELNGLTDVFVHNADLRQATKVIGGGFDVVTVNPPYEPAVKKDFYTEQDICKTEAAISLEEIIACSSSLLRYGGNFFMVNRVKRLSDVVYFMKKYKIEPKKITFIQPKASKAIDAFVVEGKLGGNPGLTAPAPLVVYEENGDYTEQARRLYGK